MIDTIILRLHNLEKYEASIKMLQFNDQTGYSVETGKVDMNEVNQIKNETNKKTKQILEFMKKHSTGDFLVKSQRGTAEHSSGHYQFTYVVNWSKDYLEMSFSIPKYLHGTNVLMYVEHSHDVHYKLTENNRLEYNIKKAPALFMGFIKRFLQLEFIDRIDLKDVEINRIDVCFNQVFESKEAALYYLRYQKKIRKKHSRDEEGLPINYGTSLMHTTQRHSVKIYHKGAEYLKNDLKQHLRINQEKKFEYFNTKKIAQLADRILRYEVTIRKSELNYLFKHNIFRKDCKDFQLLYSIYLKVEATLQRIDRISKKIGTLKKEDKEMYRKLHPEEKISKDDRMKHRYMSKLLETSPTFMLETNHFSNLYNSETILMVDSNKQIECDTAKFSKELVTLCLKKLTDFIDEFQLKELPDEETISIMIDRYNNSHKQKLPQAEMLKFYDLLVKSGSFKEAVRLSRYTKATLYRYKSRFKILGITEQSIKPEENFDFPKASLDLKEYHAFLFSNWSYFKIKPVFYEVYG